MVTEGVYTPAHALAEALRRREVSSVEVVDVYLAQIARHNPDLHSIVVLDEDGARARAWEADAALGRGETWGALHGVPITLEDAHPVSGMRSTWGGLPRLADHVPDQDGTVAARLKATGAVLLGKTNDPEIWPDSIFARTNNPWDLTRTPGGSSAGVGAALAAGLTPLDIGLDTLGSIQNPAHYTAERHGEEPAEPSREYPYALSAVSGCPMVVIPAGVDSEGLPFGIQILGKRWSDERLLGIAESVSGLTGGFRRPPGY